MKPKPNPVVYFDISIDNRPAGRIEFTLRSDCAPRTCENFRCVSFVQQQNSINLDSIHVVPFIAHSSLLTLACFVDNYVQEKRVIHKRTYGIVDVFFIVSFPTLW